jgi:hypothetical protein
LPRPFFCAPNFLEGRKVEVRRIHLLRTLVNKGKKKSRGVAPQPQVLVQLLLINVLLYDRAKLLVGEPLLGVNLVGVLAGYFEQLFVVVGLQVVAL